MALISQILTVSYPAVLADQRKAANQWADSSFLTELDRQGGIDYEDLGPTIDVPLDYQRNQGATFLSSELVTTSTDKTEVLTTAQYTPAELLVPITWSKRDEALNPTVNQKIALVKGLITNALATHDDLLEQYLFATSTNGFLGLVTHVPSTGQSSDGGIDSTTYTFWRNQTNTYVDDTDIESGATVTFNQCAKGSGSKIKPSLLVSDATTCALFEGTQQGLQRYDSQDFKAGAKSLMFKTATWVFSQYAGTSVYFLNSKAFKLVVSKGNFRDLGDTLELTNQTGFTRKMYSALQTVVTNRSRLGILHL